ncbi:hypothetical protein BDW02DRAFT_579527 [Decorospora gaudefroyi]|uniref:Uncharacterized protein n=1 Tax=Decorospora gaudefroyi TaxID=184978 RepID=A0A6A5KJ98_9PLEO|nr:hypothetical protein BDW02DRAFT_579527 [Decorospora gaudefroyi]
MAQAPDLASGIILESLSNGLNITRAQLTNLLGKQPPVSNLLLMRHANPQFTSRAEADSMAKDKRTHRAFVALYWTSLAVVTALAVAAMTTKLMRSTKPDIQTKVKEMPSDIERWHLRRQRARDASLHLQSEQ